MDDVPAFGALAQKVSAEKGGARLAFSGIFKISKILLHVQQRCIPQLTGRGRLVFFLEFDTVSSVAVLLFDNVTDSSVQIFRTHTMYSHEIHAINNEVLCRRIAHDSHILDSDGFVTK